MPPKASTTHVLLDNELVLYRRERSSIWQCRLKVDGFWQRATTKERDLAKAKKKASELRVEAEIRRRANLPVISRNFRSVAKLAIQRIQDEAANGKGKVSHGDYIRVIENYLIPCLGKRNITSIDYSALETLEAWTTGKMGKAPSQSTMLTHNAALNRVFDEAVIRGFLTTANRPKLEAKGRVTDKRPAFDMGEVRALIAGFEGWIDRARNEISKESRMLMRDYVMVLLDTGARPGKELLNLKWKQIRESIDPIIKPTGKFDKDQDEIIQHDLRRSVDMVVTGKTGSRIIVGMQRTVGALRAIGKRNYDIAMPVLHPLKNLIKATNNDFVFRTRGKVDPSSSFQKMFEEYLKDHNLLIDPRTERKRVFYSLRHTYATFALENDKTPVHTLAEHMGTSVGMIEKHYSHLSVLKTIAQLRGEETRRMIDAQGAIDEAYRSTKAAKLRTVERNRRSRK